MKRSDGSEMVGLAGTGGGGEAVAGEGGDVHGDGDPGQPGHQCHSVPPGQ